MQLTPKDTIAVEIKGETSLASVPATGSYKIYNLAGETTFTGDLQKAMTITGTAKPYDFTLEVEFPLTEGSFIRGSQFFEFGVDVFQASSGADEGMCIEISNEIYVKYEEDKPVPPGPAFDMNCDDHGDGTFSAHVHKIVPTPITSPGCSGCDLDWYYCPRDPVRPVHSARRAPAPLLRLSLSLSLSLSVRPLTSRRYRPPALRARRAA